MSVSWVYPDKYLHLPKHFCIYGYIVLHLKTPKSPAPQRDNLNIFKYLNIIAIKFPVHLSIILRNIFRNINWPLPRYSCKFNICFSSIFLITSLTIYLSTNFINLHNQSSNHPLLSRLTTEYLLRCSR